jgi:hypothetical protein
MSDGPASFIRDIDSPPDVQPRRREYEITVKGTAIYGEGALITALGDAATARGFSWEITGAVTAVESVPIPQPPTAEERAERAEAALRELLAGATPYGAAHWMETVIVKHRVMLDEVPS